MTSMEQALQDRAADGRELAVELAWEFRCGERGSLRCDSRRAALIAIADMRPDCRIWLSGEMVQEGWADRP